MTVRRLLESPLPLAAAPMAGGPTTAVLAEAAARAGAFPFLAGGYRSRDALCEEIDRFRSAGLRAPFGVNLFVPGDPDVDLQAFRAYAEQLAPEAARYGIELDPAPVRDDDRWSEKLALLIEQPVPVVSLTFGLPDPADISALQHVGSAVVATVTSAEEAVTAGASGVDGLIVQGSGAGGHSAIHDPNRNPGPVTTVDLLEEVRGAVDLPLAAAGGVDGPEAVRRLIDSGAETVVVGTLLLRSDEAGTSAVHRRALADPAFTETAVTRAFTGRPARALRTGFIDRHDSAAPTAYPAVHHLTRELRARAAAEGDVERLHLWAGTGYRSAPAEPVGNIIRWLLPDSPPPAP